MACQFTFPMAGDPQELVGKAEEAIGKAGGTFSGNSGSGQFSAPTPIGKISGSYTVGPGNLTIVITEKPIFLGCGMIESYLKKYL